MNLTIHASISIKALPSKVWEALTDTELSEKYLHNVFARDGAAISAKGKIVGMIPEKLLHTLYPKGINEEKGIEYYNIIYELEAEQDITVLKITQEDIENEGRAGEIKKNWDSFFSQIKKTTEDPV